MCAGIKDRFAVRSPTSCMASNYQRAVVLCIGPMFSMYSSCISLTLSRTGSNFPPSLRLANHTWESNQSIISKHALWRITFQRHRTNSIPCGACPFHTARRRKMGQQYLGGRQPHVQFNIWPLGSARYRLSLWWVYQNLALQVLSVHYA